MKRFVSLALALVLLFSAALADTRVNAQYTDVPTALTQDSVADIFADNGSEINTLQPDEESIALLDEIYNFVWEGKNRPARFYDEETQEKIAELANINIDALLMTEDMRLQLMGTPEEAVTVTMRLNVDYTPGQLVIIVMGVKDENGERVWYPYRGTVKYRGEIIWEVPAEDWEVMKGQAVDFQVLSVRYSQRGEAIWHKIEVPYHYVGPSIESGDVITIIEWYTEKGEVIPDDFKLFKVDLTKKMEEEVDRIGEYLSEDGASILNWFPEERKAEAALMLPEGTDTDAMIAYDIIALTAVNYRDAYGDVNTKLSFGTEYSTDKAVTVLAGFPIDGAEEAPWFEWYVLRAAAVPTDDGSASHKLEIGLKQLNLPQMEIEPMMLIIISEPVAE